MWRGGAAGCWGQAQAQSRVGHFLPSTHTALAPSLCPSPTARTDGHPAPEGRLSPTAAIPCVGRGWSPFRLWQGAATTGWAAEAEPNTLCHARLRSGFKVQHLYTHMPVGFKAKILPFESQFWSQLNSQHCSPEINLPVFKQVNLAGRMELGFQFLQTQCPWRKVGGRASPCPLGSCGQPCISSPLPHHI